MGLVVVALGALGVLVALYVVLTLVARVLTLDTGYYAGERDLRSVPTIAIVTGATSGVGTKTAEEFAADGAHVFLCDRDDARSAAVAQRLRAATGNEHVVPVHCDLADLASVKECAMRLLRAAHELRSADAAPRPWRVLLCNNAGVMAVPLSASAQGYEMQYAVNFLGHFALTANLLPLLLDRDLADCRVVTLSSMAHRWPKAFDFATLRADQLDARTFDSRNFGYARSKLADVYLTAGLARLAAAHPEAKLAAYSVDPGNVMTNLGRHMPLYFFVLGAPILYLCQKTCCQGAQTTITCALDRKDRLVNGGYYANRRLDDSSPAAKNTAWAQQAWRTAIEQAAPFLTEEARAILEQQQQQE